MFTDSWERSAWYSDYGIGYKTEKSLLESRQVHRSSSLLQYARTRSVEQNGQLPNKCQLRRAKLPNKYQLRTAKLPNNCQ
jgi:hypothetical protein